MSLTKMKDWFRIIPLRDEMTEEERRWNDNEDTARDEVRAKPKPLNFGKYSRLFDTYSEMITYANQPEFTGCKEKAHDFDFDRGKWVLTYDVKHIVPNFEDDPKFCSDETGVGRPVDKTMAKFAL